MSFSAGKNLQNNVNVTEAQTLSNKTLDNTNAIDGASVDNSTITGASIESPSRLDMKKDTLANLQIYAASATNGQLVYATDAKKTFQVVDAALVEVGGGSAAINYIENSDAEQNVDGWNRYVDAVQSIPEDGTGGLILDITFTQNTTSPLRGTADFNLNKRATDAQGQGVAYDFTIDKADQAKKLTISFDYDASDANYADDDIGVFIYDVTNSNLIRVNGENLKGGKGKHYAQFQTAADSTSYRLILHIASTNATEYDVYFDNFSVGPRELAKGTIVTDWISYTPTSQGLGNPTFETAMYKRVGDSLFLQVTLTTGTTTAVEAQIGLPSGLVVDSVYSNITDVGSVQRNYTVTNHFSALATSGDSFLNFGTRGASSNILSPQDGSALFLSAENLTINAHIKIQGWSSNAVTSEDLGGREVVVRGVGNSGAAITANTERIDFTVVEDTTASWSQVDGNGTDTFTAPETGYYAVSGSVRLSATDDNFILAFIDNVEFGPLGNSRGSSALKTFSGHVYLEKGQTLDLRLGINATLSNVTTDHRVHIQKLASPQTVLETETVSLKATSSSGQTVNNTQSTFIYEDKEYDTHSAYNTSTGEFTAPVSGFYQVNSTVSIDNTNLSSTDFLLLANVVDGINIDQRIIFGNGASNDFQIEQSNIVKLNKGQVLEIQARCQVSSSAETNSLRNSLSIHRLK